MAIKKISLYVILVGLTGLLIALSIPAIRTNMTDLTAKAHLFAPTVDPAPGFSETGPRSDYFAILAAVRANDNKAALTTIQALPPERQTDPLIQNQLAEIWFSTGRVEDAARLWASIGNFSRIQTLARQALQAGQFQQSILLNGELYQVRPDLVSIDLATAYQRNGEFAEAESVLKYFIESRPNIAQSQLLRWQLMLANLRLQQKKWGEAAGLYQQIFQDYPDNTEACIGLSQALVMSAGVENAVAAFKQCIAIDPGKPGAYVTLADTLSSNQRYTEAEVWYDQAAQHFNGDYTFWRHRAENAVAGSNFVPAVGFYQAALASAGSAAEKIDALRGLATAYLILKDVPHAKDSILAAIVLDARNVSILVLAGRIYEQSGELRVAIEYYQQVLDLDPANHEAASALSRLKP